MNKEIPKKQYHATDVDLYQNLCFMVKISVDIGKKVIYSDWL